MDNDVKALLENQLDALEQKAADEATQITQLQTQVEQAQARKASFDELSDKVRAHLAAAV